MSKPPAAAGQGTWRGWDARATYRDNVAAQTAERDRMLAGETRSGRPGKWWAADVLARYQRGDVLPDYTVRLAVAALGLDASVITRKPSRRISPHDGRALAAGQGRDEQDACDEAEGWDTGDEWHAGHAAQAGHAAPGGRGDDGGGPEEIEVEL